MDLDKIKDFIRFISKSGVTDISLETEDFKISSGFASISVRLTGFIDPSIA